MTRLSPIILLALTAACANAQSAPPAEAWWGHIATLAHDSMRGRLTGSPEHRRAAEYVAGAFERAGLQPGNAGQWFQPVRFQVRRIDESRSRVALVRGGRTEPLALGTEAVISVRSSSEGSVEAPLVFAGYGVRAADHGVDDFAGLDLRGKMVVLLSGVAPKGIPGPALAAGRSAGSKAIQEGGAAGVVTIYSPGSDLPWSRYALSRLQPQMRLAESPGHQGGGLIAVVVAPTLGERLFAGSRHAFAELRALADSGAPLPHFDLAAKVRATAAMSDTTAISDNVVGLLPGSDPALAGEYVALTAHLDHLGVGEPIDGDSIYNGAMDNASGIATLIETAATLAGGAMRLKRPVFFVAVTAEEMGLLGSDYFAEHPPIPSGKLVANVNTDMFLPLSPLRQVLVNGLEESNLADDVRRAAGRTGVEVITDPEPERNAFVRSDQFSFIRRGIPAVSLKVGFTLDSPEYQRVLDWRHERYHGVDDETDQPVDRQAAADFNRLYAEVVTEIANRTRRPEWYPTSAFRGVGTE
jgi:Zn-dependent M28 family amino/carboxypeptidase